MGLSDVKSYIIAGFIIAIIGCGAVFGFVVNLDKDVTVRVESTEGVPGAIGEGTYHKGDTIVLTASVSFGWIFDGWYDSDGNFVSNDKTIVFTTSGDVTFSTKSHKGYGVALYGEHGVYSLTGEGNYENYENVSVSVEVADGYEFKGWYDVSQGKIVSTKNSYTVPRANTTLIAKTDSGKSYSGDNHVSLTSASDYNVSKTDVVVTDRFSGDVVYSKSGAKGCELDLKPGIYQWTVKGYLTNGKWHQSTETVIVGSSFVCDYEWYYKSVKYSLSITVDYQEYKDYCEKNSNGRAPQTDSTRLKLVDYNSSFVTELATKLSSKMPSTLKTDVERANFVLKFVQLCTKYQTDIDRYNQLEHWKYPMETIFERSGDCEDTSILYSALMKAMGYDSCLVLYIEGYKEGHAGSGVGLDDGSGSGRCYPVGGVNYYYCETTSDEKDVGEPTTGYDDAQVLVVP